MSDGTNATDVLPEIDPARDRADAVGQEPVLGGWRHRLYVVIFEADTPAGRAFDVALLAAIVLSIAVVMAESVRTIDVRYHRALVAVEWGLTVLFTLEYVLRLLCVRRPARYARSFFGVIDVLAVLPTYLSLLVPGTQSLVVIRSLRLLRVFRVFKLAHFLGEATVLRRALWRSRQKVVVFISAVLVVVTILGSVMYLVESPVNSGFSSIPRSMYWTVVTMTTVGYGDIKPETPLGQFVASIIMVLGYSLIIVPTGIVSAELAGGGRGSAVTTRACPECLRHGHDADAAFCKFCAARLGPAADAG